jgi:predicted Na+-dependent transporter
MFVGTMIGVFVTPGLYYLFAKLAGDGRLLKDDGPQHTHGGATH